MKIPFPKYDPDLIAEIEMFLDQDYLTEITDEALAGAAEDGLVNTWARGFGGTSRPGIGGARNPSNYARPMFQVLHADYTGFRAQSPRAECPACYDFSRSWNCPEHREVPYDTELKSFVRPTVQPLGDEDIRRFQLFTTHCGCAMCRATGSPIMDQLNRRQTREIGVEAFDENGRLSAFSFRAQPGD